MLTPDEINRYAQQLKLQNIGLEGQLKLKKSRVLCIGAGGLGSSVLLYLAASGVGVIGIVDDDQVELSNLQRQILYQHQHIGSQKSQVAKKQLEALNPSILVVAYDARLDLSNASNIIAQYDIVVDCSDNFYTHYLINDVCFYLNKPYIFASISKFKGQCAFFFRKDKPCFRCLFPISSTKNALPDCAEDGVLGVLPGLLGTIQATEVIKWILELNDSLLGYLLVVDVLKMQFQKFNLTHNPDCDLCVHKKSTEFLLKTYHDSIDDFSENVILASELREKLKNKQDFLLLDVRTAVENLAYNLGGLLIPIDQLADRLSELDSCEKIIVYCQSGKRSMEAVRILRSANFKFVKHLQGGVNEWRSCFPSPLVD